MLNLKICNKKKTMDPAMHLCPIQRLGMKMILFKSEPKHMMLINATRPFMEI